LINKRAEYTLEYKHLLAGGSDLAYQVFLSPILLFFLKIKKKIVSGGMLGSDIVTMYRSGNNGKHINEIIRVYNRFFKKKAFLQDRKALAQGTLPEIDPQADWVLTNSANSNGQSYYEFNRLLLTTDCDRDVEIVSGPNKIIFAWSDSLPASPGALSYHGSNRDATQISFFGPPINPPIDLSGTTTFNVTVPPNFNVPSRSTSYWCQKVSLPQDQQYQVISFRPLISNVQVVHHIVIYACPEDFFPVTNNGFCEDIQEFNNCTVFWFVWAKGGSSIDMPNQMGVPMGPGAVRTVYLQIHYDNPTQSSSQVDSSGVTLYYLPKSRPIDVGVFEFGRDLSAISIPPSKIYKKKKIKKKIKMKSSIKIKS
jgi:hypothetical protein